MEGGSKRRPRCVCLLFFILFTLIDLISFYSLPVKDFTSLRVIVLDLYQILSHWSHPSELVGNFATQETKTPKRLSDLP